MNRREVIAGAAATVAAAALPVVPAVSGVPAPECAVYRIGDREIVVELNWVWREMEWSRRNEVPT
jgi:hypothetical protein